MERMAKTCEEAGAEFVLMKFGMFLAPSLPYALDLEKRFVASKDALSITHHYLDLDEVFRAESFDAVKLTSGNDDGHWNAFGHEQVAIAVEAYLANEGLLDAETLDDH